MFKITLRVSFFPTTTEQRAFLPWNQVLAYHLLHVVIVLSRLDHARKVQNRFERKKRLDTRRQHDWTSELARKVRIPFCKTHGSFQSFLPLTSEEWNHLPTHITSITNQLFKNAIADIVYLEFYVFAHFLLWCPVSHVTTPLSNAIGPEGMLNNHIIKIYLEIFTFISRKYYQMCAPIIRSSIPQCAELRIR